MLIQWLGVRNSKTICCPPPHPHPPLTDFSPMCKLSVEAEMSWKYYFKGQFPRVAARVQRHASILRENVRKFCSSSKIKVLIWINFLPLASGIVCTPVLLRVRHKSRISWPLREMLDMLLAFTSLLLQNEMTTQNVKDIMAYSCPVVHSPATLKPPKQHIFYDAKFGWAGELVRI